MDTMTVTYPRPGQFALTVLGEVASMANGALDDLSRYIETQEKAS